MQTTPSRWVCAAAVAALAAILSGLSGGLALAQSPTVAAPSGASAADGGQLVAAADPQAAIRDDPVSLRIPFPIVREAGTLEWRGKAFRLDGVEITALDATCGEDAKAWPCGQMALTAVRGFVRGRTLDCTPAPGGDRALVRCALAGQDVAEWLVAQGWAKAASEAYRDAETEARDAGLGLWSPARPSIAKRAYTVDLAGDPGEAAVLVQVHLATQQLTLFHNGEVVAQWPVSTARAGKITPTGRWRAQWLSRNHRSSLYNNAPMPYSVFFNGDYAIHGTNDVGRLGRPASAGCIRLHPSHAAVIFDLVRREGVANTLVVVSL